MGVARVLHDFVVDEALPGTGIEPAVFWPLFGALIRDLAPRNAALLARRAELQDRIDAWYDAHAGQAHDPAAHEAFLREIGYLVPEPPPFEIETANVDPEIASIAGPQLVVPVMNARYALNAANARGQRAWPTDATSSSAGAMKRPDDGPGGACASHLVSRNRWSSWCAGTRTARYRSMNTAIAASAACASPARRRTGGPSN